MRPIRGIISRWLQGGGGGTGALLHGLLLHLLLHRLLLHLLFQVLPQVG